MNQKPLIRSANKRVAGVIGGIAEYFGIDPTLARVAFIFIMVFTGLVPAIVFYLIAMLVMPSSGNTNNSSLHNHNNQHIYTNNSHHSDVHGVTYSESHETDRNHSNNNDTHNNEN